MSLWRAGLFSLLLSASCLALGDAPLRIAVAANFKPTLELLVASYTGNKPIAVDIIPGATGVLYAQILAGAPFDIFLAADTDRPERLDVAGLIEPGSRFTYAVGQLAFWQPGTDTPVTMSTLQAFNGTLALANPRLAPYGVAAQSVLDHFKPTYKRLVLGNNVSQAMQFIDSGNADAGFVSLSQLPGHAVPGSWWQVPANYHGSLAQQAVTLKTAHPQASAFSKFLRSEEARALILAQGYLLDSGA